MLLWICLIQKQYSETCNGKRGSSGYNLKFKILTQIIKIIYAVPGLGFLFGAGAVVGALGGLDLGIIAGGIGSILVSLGIKEDYAIKYEEHIKSGKYLVFVNGSDNDISKAKKILDSEYSLY